MQNKKVQITLEMNSIFVSILRANCTLSKLGSLQEDYVPHDPIKVCALLCLLEAMGATEEQIKAETPLEWRNDIRVITSKRKVIE